VLNKLATSNDNKLVEEEDIDFMRDSCNGVKWSCLVFRGGKRGHSR
jgi:hypothetical protein